MRAARSALAQQEGKTSPGGSVNLQGCASAEGAVGHKRSLYGKEVTDARALSIRLILTEMRP